MFLSCSDVQKAKNISFEWRVEPTHHSSSFTATTVKKQLRLPTTNQQSDDLSEGPLTSLTLSLLEQESNYAKIMLSNQESTLYSATYRQPELQGICQENTTGLPTFFIDSVEEGLGRIQREIIRQSNNGEWQAWLLSSADIPIDIEEFITPLVSCAANQTSVWEIYKSNGDIQPCSCQFPQSFFMPSESELWENAINESLTDNDADNYIYSYAGSVKFSEHFTKGAPEAIELIALNNQQEINQMIDQALFNPDYTVTDITTNNHRFINVVLEEELYKNVGLAFIQKNNLWYLWYQAGDSSKGFHPIIYNGQSTNGHLQLQLCISDCDWWGQQANVELDLTSLSIRFVDKDL